MKKIAINIPIEILCKDYLEMNSSYKVAKKYGITASAAKSLLKEAGVLRTQREAAKIRMSDPNFKKKYNMTDEQKAILSEYAKKRTGTKNPFHGKTHSEEAKRKMSEAAKKRTKERNANYKHGNYIRRPRDYKIAEFKPLRNFVFNRDKFTCNYCKEIGGHLHAHHIIPYWVKPEAYLDVDNLITVCTDCHFSKAHKGNWQFFDVALITDILVSKYSLCYERLNELATWNPSGRCDSLFSANT